MAKHCDICNHDYADDLPVCPHCADAKKTQLASSREDRATQLADFNATGPASELPPSQPEINLGPAAEAEASKKPQQADVPSQGPMRMAADSAIVLPPSVPESGEAGEEKLAPISSASNVAWAALAEDFQVEEVQVDAPSDADLLAQAMAEAEAAPPSPPEEMVGELGTAEVAASEAAAGEEEVIDLSDTPPEEVEVVSDSAVDLGGSRAQAGEGGSGAELRERPPEESEVFMAELASDASRVNLVEESGVDLSGTDVAGGTKPGQTGTVEDSSGVDIEGMSRSASADSGRHPSSDSEVNLDAHAASPPVEDGSGVDIQGISKPASADSGHHPSSDSDVDLDAEAANTLAENGSGASDSQVVGESGIDFSAGSEPAASPSDLALASLMSDESSKERLVEQETAAGEEPALSEKEVDDLLADLDEKPAEDVRAVEEEEAAAAVEEEETEAEKKEEKPAKPVKQGSRVPALVGGTVLGVLLGAGGLIGARFGGIDVPAMIGAGGKEPAPKQAAVAQTAAATPEQMANMLRNGDYKAAAEAGIERLPGTTSDQLAERGECRLGLYLQGVGNKKIDLQDPGLQQAVADLTKAAEGNNANAIYSLGLINELANNFPKASEEYKKGLQAFQNQPTEKRRFQSALDRVEWKASEQAAGAAQAPLRERERIALLALLLVNLQQPAPQQQPGQQPPAQAQPGQQPQAPAPAQASEEEAGFEFWDAAKLARQRKFAEAVRTLDKARALHQERRFSRLRKAQNPLSDPTEEIFLRCCDELKAYWQMQDHLRDGGYLTDKNNASQALNNLVQAAENSTETLKGISKKLVMGKVIAEGDDVSKGIDKTLAAKKDAEDAVADLTIKLKKAADEAADLGNKLKTAEGEIKDREDKLAAADEAAKKLKADNAGLNATLKKITDELTAARLVDPREKLDVGAAVKKAVDVAKIKDPNGVMSKQRSDIAQLTAVLSERWRPEQMMPLWLLLLEQNRNRTDLANKAAQDAGRVQAGPTATTAQRGEAQIVQGLALRNSEKFVEAKAALEAGRRTVDRGEWLMIANVALREVSDPATYYGMQAQELFDRGQLDAALALLDRALKVLPAAQHPKLFAQRSLIELDAARSRVKGTLSPRDPLVAAASKDAAAAAKAGLAEGHYAAGRVAEAMGQWDAAIQSYRKALAAHGAVDAEGGRYRMALARVLLQPRNAPPPPRQAAPVPAGNKVGWRDPAPYPARQRLDMKQAVLMLVLGLQAPLLPGEEPGLDEAEKLADEILRARPGTVPFNIHAQALAIKGLWSEALREYVAGIRPLLPRELGDGLMYLILNDPRLKRPDSLRIPNPMEAERHFAAGINFYFDGDFVNAEQEFLLTIRNDSQDARYFYFLGLSRLARRNRREALADFAAGAELERVNRPAPATVNESLERIQGPMRCIVNEYRYRPERLEPVEPARRP